MIIVPTRVPIQMRLVANYLLSSWLFECGWLLSSWLFECWEGARAIARIAWASVATNRWSCRGRLCGHVARRRGTGGAVAYELRDASCQLGSCVRDDERSGADQEHCASRCGTVDLIMHCAHCAQEACCISCSAGGIVWCGCARGNAVCHGCVNSASCVRVVRGFIAQNETCAHVRAQLCGPVVVGCGSGLSMCGAGGCRIRVPTCVRLCGG